MVRVPPVRHGGLYFLIPILAVISAGAFISYMMASRSLSLSLFGLLGYVEPVLIVVVSLLLGEQVKPNEWRRTYPFRAR